MSKVAYKPSSSRNASTGRWVPSGTVVFRDNVGAVEISKSYATKEKNSKKDADIYFVKEERREIKSKSKKKKKR